MMVPQQQPLDALHAQRRSEMQRHVVVSMLAAPRGRGGRCTPSRSLHRQQTGTASQERLMARTHVSTHKPSSRFAAAAGVCAGSSCCSAHAELPPLLPRQLDRASRADVPCRSSLSNWYRYVRLRLATCCCSACSAFSAAGTSSAGAAAVLLCGAAGAGARAAAVAVVADAARLGEAAARGAPCTPSRPVLAAAACCCRCCVSSAAASPAASAAGCGAAVGSGTGKRARPEAPSTRL
jgi:hypothetical protein